jgi:hypothetical protein
MDSGTPMQATTALCARHCSLIPEQNNDLAICLTNSILLFAPFFAAESPSPPTTRRSGAAARSLIAIPTHVFLLFLVSRFTNLAIRSENARCVPGLIPRSAQSLFHTS